MVKMCTAALSHIKLSTSFVSDDSVHESMRCEFLAFIELKNFCQVRPARKRKEARASFCTYSQVFIQFHTISALFIKFYKY